MSSGTNQATAFLKQLKGDTKALAQLKSTAKSNPQQAAQETMKLAEKWGYNFTKSELESALEDIMPDLSGPATGYFEDTGPELAY